MKDLANSVAAYLDESGSFILPINPSVVGSSLKILTFESNTYIYEVNGQKISNSLNLTAKIEKFGYAYLIERNKLVLFYVAATDSRLFIIRRSVSCLEVVKEYDNVENFHILDFMCLGYPQIEIEFGNLSKSIIEFPIDDVKTCESKTNVIAKDLAEELQTVYKHVNELSAEWNRIRCLLENDTDLENCYTLSVSSLKFSSPQEECTDKVTIISRWKSMLQYKLILGLEIQNKDKKIISDLEFKIYEKSIKEYTYSFFSTSDEILIDGKKGFFSSRTKNASVAPGENIRILGAIPAAQLNFAFRTKIPITCCVTSGKLKDYLVKETFEITFEDVLDRKKELFVLRQNYDLQQKFIPLINLQTIQAAKTETKLKIQAKYLSRYILEETLKKDFKLEEIIPNKFYYSNPPYLNEVFVYLQGVTLFENILKIILYTSHDYQVYYIVNMLLELLPEYATVLYDDDE